MINAYVSSLRNIYNTIPEQILTAAFQPSNYQVTLDQRIKDVIINGRVLSDCNIISGKIKRIPLDSCEIENTLPDPGFNDVVDTSSGSLYRIPPQAREFRDIVSVIDMSYQYNYSGAADATSNYGMSANTVRSLAAAMLDSHTYRNAALTPTPILMANNMVLINPSASFLNNWCLVCRLGYDEEFTNLSNSSIRPLTNLITTATKAYIWVNLTIRIDQAELSGGQELGQFKSIVDKYEGELDKYQDDLKSFQASTLFDAELTRYLIRSSI